MVIADFNGDGILDIAYDYDPTQVLFGNGDGTFRVGPSNDNVFGGDEGLAVGDFNGDGIPDLVAGSSLPKFWSVTGTAMAHSHLDR